MTTEKTYNGSCHCGAIKFTVKDLKLDDTTLGKCNCSKCSKTNMISIQATPEQFEIEKPASVDAIDGQYQFNSKNFTHYFCKTCGVNVFISGFGSYYINATAFDDTDFSQIKIKRYVNGKDNDWTNVKETPHAPGAF